MFVRKSGSALGAVAVGLWIAAAVALAAYATVTGTQRGSAAHHTWVLRAGAVRPGLPLVLLVVALATTLIAWLLLARMPGLVDRPYLLVGVFGLILLVTPPLFSNDLYAYVEAGWVQSQHLDPYLTPVGTLDHSPVASLVQSWWGSYTPYGPGALGLFHLVGAVTGYRPMAFVIVFRALCLAAICAMVPLVRSIAREFGVSPRYAVWAGVLNPLVLIHGIGGAHLDVPAILLVLLGVRFALVPRWRTQVAAMVAVGLAASMRQPAALMGLFVCATAIRLLDDRLATRGLRMRAAVVVGGALIGLATIQAMAFVSGDGWGWVHNLQTPAASSLTPVGFATVLSGRSAPPPGMLAAAMLLAVVVAYGLAMRTVRVNPLFAVAVALGTFQAISLASYHTWYYVLPVIVLACAARGSTQRWIVPALVVVATQLDLWGDQGFPAVLSGQLGSPAAAAVCVLALIAGTTVALLALARQIVPTTGDISFAEPRWDLRAGSAPARR